eukprot:scaffold2504_cov248-Chaetoceros_neogracile.AAC.9
MDELRESLRRGDADAGGEQPVDFAVDDKKMIKKIANLNDQLLSLGEASTVEDSKESRNVAVSPLSIDRLLDWMFMCMHLQTKDLPKLFTDTDNDPLDGGDKKLLKWEI